MDTRLKLLLASTLLAFVAACGGEPEQESCEVEEEDGDEATLICPDGSTYTIEQPEDGDSCTVEDHGDGTATIECEDGSSFVVEDGQDGEDGASCTVQDNEDGTYTHSCDDGTEVTFEGGESCTVEDHDDDTYTLTCDDGTSATFGDGEDGDSCSVSDDGEGEYTLTCDDGSEVSWTDGADGATCSVSDDGEGEYSLECDDGTEVTWSDGADGEDGEDGEDGDSCSVSDDGDGNYTLECDDGTEVTWSDGEDGDGDNCTVDDHGDGTATVECPDGSEATFDLSDGDSGDPDPGDGVDLAVTDFSVTATEDDVEFDVEVTNQGDEDAEELFYVDFHLHEDAEPAPEDWGEDYAEFDGLDAGDSVTVTETVVQYDGDGIYDAWVSVDPEDNDDVDESNNVAGPETYRIGVDLAVTDFDVTVSGDDVEFDVVVENIGSWDAVGTFYVDLFLHEDSEPDVGEVGDEYQAFDELDAGDSVTVTETITQSDGSGTYDAWVVVDSDPDDNDIDLDNNVDGPETYTIQ